LLGPPRIEINGLPVKVETRKVMALLAYLAVMGDSYRRDSLVNLLWPEYDLAHGRAVLRRTLSALHSALPDSGLVTDRDTIGLNPQIDLWLDVREFHYHLDRRRSHGHAESEVCPDCLTELIQAINLYRDDFLSGFTLPDSFNFDDWQLFQTETLRQEMGTALGKLVQCLILKGEFEPAIQYTRRRLALDPLNEDVHCELMRLYNWTQQRNSALHQFEECKKVLQIQLGVDPEKSTIDLAQVIKTGRASPPPSNPSWQSLKVLSQSHTRVDSFLSIDKKVDEKRIVTALSFEVCLLDSLTNEGDEEDKLEERAQRFERFLEQIKPILAQYGGQIEGQIGESLLVVFGLVHTHENDPELALRAAIDIHRESKRSGLSIAAGITTGEVYMKSDSTPEAETHNLTGNAIDMAFFLAGQAQAGKIYVAESTYQFTRNTFEFTPLTLTTKLQGTQVKVYQVEGLLAQAHKTRGIQGLRSPLVGRERELDELQKALERVEAGSGQLAVVIGDAGVGKSRLVEEFRQRALMVSEKSGLRWLEGRCLELSKDVSYWPFLDFLKVDFGWQAQDDSWANRDRIEKAIRQLVSSDDLTPEGGKEVEVVLNHLLSTYSGADGEDLLATQTPDEIRQRTFLTLRNFLLALSHQQPLVLVFEDLHWADPLSLDLIYFLMETLSRGRILLITVYRPEQEYRTYHLLTVAERKCLDRFTEIHLHELSQPESYQMIDFLLGEGHLAERIKALIWERCQGNPFYIEEVIQSLIEVGVIYSANNRRQLAAEFDPRELPASVQSVILSRLDHLEEDYRQVLLTAAVIGRVFPKKVLQQAMPEGIDLEKALWDLEGRGLVYQERAIPEVEYSFRHVLMQEAIYHNTLRHRRKILHQSVAETIEKLYSERLDEHYEQLAFHYEKSGNIHQTIDYLYKAGEKAVLLYSNEAAIAHFSKGLELLHSLPETLERNQQEISFLIALGVPLFHARGQADEQLLDTYTQARDLCQKTKDTSHLFYVLLGLRRYALTRGGMGEAIRLGQQMLELGKDHDNPIEQARAYMMLVESLYFAGEFVPTPEYCRKGLALCQDQNPYTHINLYGNDTRLGCQMTLPPTLWLLGYPDQALVELHREQAMLAGIPHPFSRVMGLLWTSMGYQLLKQFQVVQSQAEELLQIAREHGFALFQAWGLGQLGWSLVAQNQLEQGIDCLQQGVDRLQHLKLITLFPEAFAQLGEALAQSGQIQAGLAAIEAGIAIGVESGSTHWLAEMHRLKGKMLQKEEKQPGAEDCFMKAIEIARQQQARSWELRATTSLARLWQAQGKQKEAFALLNPIYRWFTEGFETTDLLHARAILDQLKSD